MSFRSTRASFIRSRSTQTFGAQGFAPLAGHHDPSHDSILSPQRNHPGASLTQDPVDRSPLHPIQVIKGGRRGFLLQNLLKPSTDLATHRRFESLERFSTNQVTASILEEPVLEIKIAQRSPLGIRFRTLSETLPERSIQKRRTCPFSRLSLLSRSSCINLQRKDFHQ